MEPTTEFQAWCRAGMVSLTVFFCFLGWCLLSTCRETARIHQADIERRVQNRISWYERYHVSQHGDYADKMADLDEKIYQSTKSDMEKSDMEEHKP